MSETLDLRDLNDNQRAAVTWTGGGLLVLAGPGSGKTKVLTLRVAKLLLDAPNDAFRVLALTFTKKAAGEMRERVGALSPKAGARARLSTFHSFSVDVLRQHGSHIGLTPDFRVIDDRAERQEIAAEALERAHAARSNVSLALQQIESLAERGLDRAEVDKSCTAVGDTVLPGVYRAYFGLLLKRQCLDFPGLVLATVTLLRRHPAVGRLVRTIYPYVCVDEFQDTNEGQYRLLRELVGDDPSRLFVVADDDQLLYRWRGASPGRLSTLKNEFALETMQLPTNYRCPPEVIELANRLILNNAMRTAGKQPLVAAKQKSVGDAVRVMSFDRPELEVEWIAADIAARRQGSDCSCAVLARNRKIVEPMVAALQSHNIAATLVVRRDQFTSAPLRWLHSVLTLRHRGLDRRQLARACGAFRQLTDITLDTRAIESAAAAIPELAFSALFDAAGIASGLADSTRAFLKDAHSHLVESQGFLAVCERFWPWFDECRVTACSDAAFAEYDEERQAWVDTQSEVVREFGKKELSLAVFLQELAVGTLLPSTPPEVVQCMTIHGAKGLEFEHVYVMGLAEDLLPGFQAIRAGAASAEMEEERRGCFVAVTRTETTLTLTRALKYNGYAKLPSRFLTEIGLA